MNIKDGDVLTLDNGDVVRVTLEIVEQIITHLEPNQRYILKHSTQYCHVAYVHTCRDYDPYNDIWTYVGRITSSVGDRNIFYNVNTPSVYLMYGTQVLDYIVKKVKS